MPQTQSPAPGNRCRGPYFRERARTKTLGRGVSSVLMLRYNLLRKAALLLAASLTAPAARAQDVYFSQPFATRLHANPAFAGLLDDYSATLSFRTQLPTLAGSFDSAGAAADWRPDVPGRHHAFGLLIDQDQAGAVGYTRLEARALYAYHTRLTRQVALSGGLGAGYGRQRVGYDNFTFGDQISPDGRLTGPSAESLDFAPLNYFSVGTGLVLYSDQAWLSLAGQHLNQPSLGFRQQSRLPLLLNVSGGYKFFVTKPGPGTATRELSYTPVAAYSQQGGSRRLEAGLYFTASPVTLGAVYRNLFGDARVGPQQLLALVAGVSAGGLRLGYSYDVGLSRLSADLGGAHEITLAIRAFDTLENAYQRIRRRNYPIAPCPAF